MLQNRKLLVLYLFSMGFAALFLALYLLSRRTVSDLQAKIEKLESRIENKQVDKRFFKDLLRADMQILLGDNTSNVKLQLREMLEQAPEDYTPYLEERIAYINRFYEGDMNEAFVVEEKDRRINHLNAGIRRLNFRVDSFKVQLDEQIRLRDKHKMRYEGEIFDLEKELEKYK